MNRPLRNGVVIVTVLSAISACHSGRAALLPTAPTASSSTFSPLPPPPRVSADAIPIDLGQTVNGVVTLADPTCDPGHPGEPPEPCQRFAIAIPTSGTLKVQIATRGPYSFTLGIGPIRQWGTTVAVGVQADSTYEISVALHGRLEGITSQTFELTTSLEAR
jgi:hypothetical protein